MGILTESRGNGPGRGLFSPVLIGVVAVAVAVLGVFAYLNSRWTGPETQAPVLTEEAREYVRRGALPLSDVEMSAKESFAGQTLVEITGKITNTGERAVRLVEVTCVFRDPYGQVVLRERLPIVSARGGGLKPGETKDFRLPFDTIPNTWNQSLPDLVIAQIQFE
ncbi:MAG TPA: FxLYD domain-containing protein [Bryobacteraceae bacterium]|nr:FxLYD domain-containing protein [Bryobacteraceae bacterium]